MAPNPTVPEVANASPPPLPSPQSAAPRATPTAAAPPAVTQAAPESRPAGNPPATATARDFTALVAAANQWRSQGVNLVGAKRIPDKPIMAGYSWMTHLLPYLGHGDLYNKFDFNKGWHDAANVEFTCEVIPAFVDPKNPNRNMRIVGAKDVVGPAFTHFVGMAGIEDARNVVAAELPRTDPRAGIFGYDQLAKPEDITDGAGNTLMLISSGKIVGPWVAGGGATVRGARAPYFDSITGFHSVGDGSGAAVAAMADGSVRRISKEIDPTVFRAMCTIHGGEKVDLP